MFLKLFRIYDTRCNTIFVDSQRFQGHLRSIRVFLRLIGIDISRLASSILSIPWYIRQYIHFSRNQGNSSFPVCFYPILFDRNEPASSLGEYFWQDLFVAERVISLNPSRHVDIGSV